MELRTDTHIMRIPKSDIRERSLKAITLVYDASGGKAGLNGRQVAAWISEVPPTVHRYLKAMQNEQLVENFTGDWWRPTPAGRAFLLNSIELRRIAS
jgi:DNA-binding IclR family transcriptional regulator